MANNSQKLNKKPVTTSRGLTRNRAFDDLTGQRFGRWRVESPEKVETGGRRRTIWRCRCDCGTERRIDPKTLKTGMSKSCGCGQITHGLTTIKGKHPVYITWVGMHTRCTNRREPHWSDYGGRGISVCARWKDVDNFLADMLPTWKPGLSIDRIDNSRGYSPDNCRWATRKQQNVNRRNVVMCDTPKGRMCLKDASKLYGVEYSTTCYRVRQGWDVMDALTLPNNARNPKRKQ